MSKKKCEAPKKVRDFLEKAGAKFELMGHKTVFTAYDKAATLKIQPKTIAKVIVVKIDNELAAAVIPGDKNLDIEKLKKTAKAKKIDFAKEAAIGKKFTGIDPGAIPPFCGLWDMKFFADKSLLSQPKIIFSAGSYEWSIKMAPSAFRKITPDAVAGNFAKPKPKPKAKQKAARAKKPPKKPTVKKKTPKKK